MTGTINGVQTAPAGREETPVRAGQPRLLQDKVRVPRQGFTVLHRRRVSGLLDDAARHRVTLVCGPPGAGKTAACASWAAAGPAAGRVAWLTLDAQDRLDWFWAYVNAALRQVPSVPGPALRALADASPQRFPLRLAETAQGLTEPLVLILDDAHTVTDPGVLAGLDVLARNAPPQLRLMLVARRAPALGLARLRVAGELADITGADLACTADEADAYFAMLGIGVSAAERNEVLSRTEGWMAGLRLAALRKGAGEDLGQGIATDYLWDEVLAQQEPATRDFLVRTSVVTELSGGLADALCARTGSESLLARLSRDNSFVTGPGENGTYRYHVLLREVLTAQLHREHRGEVPLLLGRAARWYSGAGRPADAVRCAAAAGDWDLAAQVLAEAGAGAVTPGGPGELESVLGLFPPARAAGDVAVATAWTFARLWRGDLGGAAAQLDRAAAGLARADPGRRRIAEPTLAALRILHAAGRPGSGPPESGQPDGGQPDGGQPDGGQPEGGQPDGGQPGGGQPDGGQRVSGQPDGGQRVSCQPDGGQRVSCQPDGRQPDADELARRGRSLAEAARARAGTPAEHRAAGLLWFALGVSSLARWQPGEARDALALADAELGAGGLTALRARAAAWRALALACCGELSAAQQAAGAARAADAAPAGEAACLAGLACAQISLARDDLPTAERLLGELDQSRAGHVPGEPPVPAIGQFLRAKLLLADGDPAAATAALGRLRETWLAVCPGLAPAATVAEAEAALRAGNSRRARALLAGADGTRGDAALARGALKLADGDFAAAVKAVGPCLAAPGAAGGTGECGTGAHDRGAHETEVNGTQAQRTGALLVAAVARRRLGDVAAAAQLTEAALALAEPEGAYRAFLDGGSCVRTAITVLVPPTSRYAGFAGRVLERFEGQGHRLAAPGGDVRLTESERAVLRFLPSHMTNQEISRALFLSVNTVKTHLRSAYRKLGAGSRREAIARARRLGLL